MHAHFEIQPPSLAPTSSTPSLPSRHTFMARCRQRLGSPRDRCINLHFPHKWCQLNCGRGVGGIWGQISVLKPALQISARCKLLQKKLNFGWAIKMCLKQTCCPQTSKGFDPGPAWHLNRSESKACTLNMRIWGNISWSGSFRSTIILTASDQQYLTLESIKFVCRSVRYITPRPALIQLWFKDYGSDSIQTW